MTNELTKQETKRSVMTAIAHRYGMEPGPFEETVRASLGLEKASPGQFAAFLAVAHEYKLNPLTKEIYAFPTKSGGIQPIVGIDGWMTLANSHPMFDGMEFDTAIDEHGKLMAITATVHRKDRTHATRVTEYLSECQGNTGPWKQWPSRMLRHKVAIQAIRYAFGFAGIMEQDEYEKMLTVEAAEVRRVPTLLKAESIAAIAHEQYGSPESEQVASEDEVEA